MDGRTVKSFQEEIKEDGRSANKKCSLLQTTARLILGDLWDGSRADGTGIAQQLDLAEEYKKKHNPHSKAPNYFRFIHVKIPDLSDPSHIQQLLQFNHDAMYGNDTDNIFTKIFGEGTIFDSETHSEDWNMFHEAYLGHLYAMPRLTKLMPDMHGITEYYLKEIEDANCQIPDISSFSARFTMDIIGQTQLGLVDFPEEFKESFSMAVDKMMPKVANPKMGLPWVISGPLNLYDRYKGESLEQIMAPGYQDLRRLMKKNEENILTTPNWIRDIALKRAWDPKKEKSPEDWQLALDSRSEKIEQLLYSDAVVKSAALFIVVGHETSAKLLEFAFTFLADPNNNHVVKRIRDEVENCLQSRESDSLTKDDMKELTYLKAVCYESLRMRPPLPRLKGQLKQEVRLGDIGFIESKDPVAEYNRRMENRDVKDDVILPKNSHFFISTWNAHFNESVYKNPYEFNPERYLKKDANGCVDYSDLEFQKPDPHQWFPFGFGKRMCPGREFAMQEVMLALVRMFMKYDFVVDNPLRYEVNQAFSLRPRHQISAQALPIDGHVNQLRR